MSYWSGSRLPRSRRHSVRHFFSVQSKITFSLILVTASFAGCGGNATQSKTDPTQSAMLDELTPEQQQMKEKAVAAKNELFQSLLDELTKSLSKNGPAKSIAVCKERAPAIAAAVSESRGLEIGRTSFRLRNKKNVIPDWATTFVENKIEREVCVELADDGLGVLLPIRMMPTCTLCHGSKQQVSRDVQAAIQLNYPDDQATGFSEGEIRGYFWIEVPPTRRGNNEIGNNEIGENQMGENGSGEKTGPVDGKGSGKNAGPK